jgi:hypothetical protein
MGHGKEYGFWTKFKTLLELIRDVEIPGFDLSNRFSVPTTQIFSKDEIHSVITTYRTFKIYFL